MNQKISGIHHITAIASDPQRNLDFYTRILGLRLVKLTVNFDAPDTYHFYFGDEAGRPGTLLTFFPWPGARRGLHGSGQVDWISFSIPDEAEAYWVDRLTQHGLAVSPTEERFGEMVIPFADPDGLQLELVASNETPPAMGWEAGPVPPDLAVIGIHGITMLEEGFEQSAGLLRDTFGFSQSTQSEKRIRFEAPSGEPGRRVDILTSPDIPDGRMGAGIVHHVAWRTPNDEDQLAWREQLVEQGLDVTPVLDRQYFHSIYFREPGGVLFEIATDPPGFTLDEKIDCLGTSLKLPHWLEPKRDELVPLLPELKLPLGCPEPA
ncbi:MAG: ring-cleaving dioxygenase [Omnitrophica WOR_2 bacterium]